MMYTKRLTIRVTENTYDALVGMTIDEGRTMNNLVNRFLESLVDEKRNKIVEKRAPYGINAG